MDAQNTTSGCGPNIGHVQYLGPPARWAAPTPGNVANVINQSGCERQASCHLHASVACYQEYSEKDDRIGSGLHRSMPNWLVDGQMIGRRYYSVRTGKNTSSALDLPMLRRLWHTVYLEFSHKFYLQEAFGYDCVDAGQVDGTIGHDVEAGIFRRLRKLELWPIEVKYINYSEDDLFDVTEFLFDHISKPVDGCYHSYNSCGWHYSEFDRDIGRAEFRTEMNAILRDYRDGYELSEAGEILEASQPWVAPLVHATLPTYDPVNVEMRVDAAILKFRRRGAPIHEKKDAVRDLADVLEFLRPKIKTVLTPKDEGDLFNIANNFAIRHHNTQQRGQYDQSIWYSWIFYFYLATIHASVRLIKRQDDGLGS